MSSIKLTIFTILVITITVGGCNFVGEKTDNISDTRLSDFFEQSFQHQLERSPMTKSVLNIKEDQEKWDDYSDKFKHANVDIVRQELKKLKSDFSYDSLSYESKISYEFFKYIQNEKVQLEKWQYHSYPLSQMEEGLQSEIPTFLINYHSIDSIEDAQAYIERLKGIPLVAQQIIEQMKVREKAGVIVPAFVFPFVIQSSRNIISGLPFDEEGKDSPLYSDFRDKLSKLNISQRQTEALLKEVRKALLVEVGPAWSRMIAYVEELSKRTSSNSGVWSLPDGDDYYQAMLEYHTSTSMTAEEIHELGLREVERIHKEMKVIIDKLGFPGTLRDFFEHMRTSPDFYFQNTDEDRKAYFDLTLSIIEAMRAKLDQVFHTQPKAELVVQRVEEFREKSVSSAFYLPPPFDGSRPGVYYINLHDMAEAPIHEIEAIAYHEALPGHHMQIAIAMELENLPKFQRYYISTAYVEGWGLYAERLAKEMGFYQDPYSDFGRLSLELLRASRLVVDTGLHHKKWSREKAVTYLDNNTALVHSYNIRSVNRYLVLPGQATSYMVGMLKILELRERAKQEMGESFDIRDFHDVVLGYGSVPLSILEKLVEQWIVASTTK